jgi:hypothetical protein
MAPTLTGTLRLPHFHGEPETFPDESWQGYEDGIQLAYIGAGIQDTLDPAVRSAHLLLGLEGAAKLERALHPEWMDMKFEKLQQELRKTFNKPRWSDLDEISNIIQRLNESCRSYASRLRRAVRAFAPESSYTPISKKEAKAVTSDTEEEVLNEKEVKMETLAYDRVTDKLLLHYFVTGLKPELRQAVIPVRPQTMTEALNTAEAHEQYMEMLGRDRRSVHMSVADVDQTLTLHVEPAIVAASKKLTEINNRPNYNSTVPCQSELDPQDWSPKRQSETEDCKGYSCREFGHFQQECPYRDISQTNYCCHYCGKAGLFKGPQRQDMGLGTTEKEEYLTE